jgi:hypothetical protein
MSREEAVVRSRSPINYSYATIRLTQSRIDKGLIAIPTALAKWFPNRNTNIQVYLNDSSTSQSKRYSSYSGSTKECRIGGVRQWFEKNHLKSGDEIVVQVIDKQNLVYRVIPERDFVGTTQRLQTDLDNSPNESQASEELARLSDWTNLEERRVALNEFRRLIAGSVSGPRQRTARRSSRARESAPPSLRTLFGQIYQGHCQVCDFWFLKRNKDPYFEVHHLDPTGGHHPKNLVVVCGNCHNQFEHAEVRSEFNDERWLIGVSFNGVQHQVSQIVLTAEMPSFSKELFV